MNAPSKQAGRSWPVIAKVSTAVALALVTGGMSIAPAFAQRDERRGWEEQNRAGSHYRNRNDHRYQPVYRPRYQHPYHYAQPVYAPRPAYDYRYERPAIGVYSPGISLFFPLDLR
jgi:hypothetical protein